MGNLGTGDWHLWDKGAALWGCLQEQSVSIELLQDAKLVCWRIAWCGKTSHIPHIW